MYMARKSGNIVYTHHTHTHTHTHTHSAAYKRLVGTYDSQIRCGRTPFDMPRHSIAPLHKPVVASCTGPCGGLCQLEPEKDAPTHPPGVCIVYPYTHTAQVIQAGVMFIQPV